MLSRSRGYSTAARIRSIEKSNDLIGIRIRDLPACSIVPQPTTLPRARVRDSIANVAVAANTNTADNNKTITTNGKVTENKGLEEVGLVLILGTLSAFAWRN
jgi:hypothetical protein